MSEPNAKPDPVSIKHSGVAYQKQLGVALTAMGPDWARDYLANEAKVRPEQVLETIALGAKQGNRPCLEVYTKLMKWSETAGAIMVAVWQKLGVRDEQEARMRLRMAQDVEHMNEADVFTTCCEFIDEYCRSHGVRLEFPRVEVEP